MINLRGFLGGAPSKRGGCSKTGIHPAVVGRGKNTRSRKMSAINMRQLRNWAPWIHTNVGLTSEANVSEAAPMALVRCIAVRVSAFSKVLHDTSLEIARKSKKGPLALLFHSGMVL